MAETGGGPPDAGEDLGTPIEELRTYREMPSPGFLSRLRGSVRRRSLGAQIAGFGWTGFGTVFLEFLRIIHSLIQPTPPSEDEEA